ncbi:MAG: hypothetical protein ACI9G1_001707, partial [Pirellulaceae bacterium]
MFRLSYTYPIARCFRHLQSFVLSLFFAALILPVSSGRSEPPVPVANGQQK